MSEPFNPYHKWLGIPPSEMPVDYYRLLGLARFENDLEVIGAAAEQRVTHLKNYVACSRGELARKLQGQVAVAANCLLQPEKKAAYDRRLCAAIHARQRAVVPPPVATRSEPDLASLIGVATKPGPRHIPRKRKSFTAWLSWAIFGGAGTMFALLAIVPRVMLPGQSGATGTAQARTTTGELQHEKQSPSTMPKKDEAPPRDSAFLRSEAKAEKTPNPTETTVRRIVPRKVPQAVPMPVVVSHTRKQEHSAGPAPASPLIGALRPAEWSFAVPPATRPEDMSPKEFLEKYGLVKYSQEWVLEIEKSLREEFPRMARMKAEFFKAQGKVKAACAKRQEAGKAVENAKKELNAILHPQGEGLQFIDGNQLRTAQLRVQETEDSLHAADALVIAALAAAQDAVKRLAEQAAAVRKDYEKARQQYATLVDSRAIHRAVKDFNETAEKEVRLGPSEFFRNLDKMLAEVEEIVARTRSRIPFKTKGLLKYVPVALNGRTTLEMAIDSGAEVLSLSWQAARQAGIDPKSGRMVLMRDANGGVARAFEVMIPKVRVGRFTASNVKCVVSLPQAGDVPLLLGQSFLNRFTYQIDNAEQVLILSDAVNAGS